MTTASDTSTGTSPVIDADFSLVSGGLIYSLMTCIPGLKDQKYGVRRRAILFSLLTWVPLLILALIAGTFSGDQIEINFLEDFPVHIRFLFVVPLLILIEKRIDPSFIEYVRTTGHLITPGQEDRFKKIVNNIDRLSNSYIPEIIILVFIYSLLILRWDQLPIFEQTREFLIQSDSNSLSPAGWCYLLFSFPVYQLLLFRWIWRWFIWAYSVIDFSRFQFQLEAAHFDQMSGLSYLNLTPYKFSLVFVALSALLASRIGFYIVFDEATLSSFYVDILVYTVMVPLLLYGPLLFYMPKLMEAKSWAINHFGLLLTRHNNAYMRKWVDGTLPNNQPLVGSVDHSSLNDLNGSYGAVSSSKLIPWNFKMMGSTLIVIILPFVPLLLALYSASELFTKLIQSLFGA